MSVHYPARFPYPIEDHTDLEAVAFSGRHVSDEGDHMADNAARASFAAFALVHYSRRKGEDEIATDFVDLLSDLRHLADALDFDFDALLRQSLNNYVAERAGLAL